MAIEKTATVAIMDMAIGATSPDFTPTSSTINENSEICENLIHVWNKVCFRNPKRLKKNRYTSGFRKNTSVVKIRIMGSVCLKSLKLALDPR